MTPQEQRTESVERFIEQGYTVEVFNDRVIAYQDGRFMDVVEIVEDNNG